MNKGFGVIEFVVLTGLLGGLISGFITVDKPQDKKLAVEVQLHPEALKNGVAEYKNYNE
jgi:hypothetical protein